MYELITLTPAEVEYPVLLGHTAKPPAILWCAGNPEVLQTPCLSVVGSRRISGYGRSVLQSILVPLVQAGITVVSGLAYGVDAEAHRVAHKVGGRCVAVLGSGLHCVYPVSHQSLADEIVERNGCLLSEYGPTVEPAPYHFPARNRIIAGLSLVTLVVEAGERSGTLITARCALDAGREVAVVPGDIYREGSIGVHTLLKQGARPVTCSEDVLELYSMSSPVQASLQPALTGSPATLYNLISRGHATVDDLQAETGLAISGLQSILTVLEIDGYITSTDNTWHVTSLS